MVLIPFIPLSQNEFETLIKNQNRLLVAGQGHSDINIFRRYRPTRRGQGVLSFLSKYGRYALPFIKKFIIPSAKDFSKNVASDMIGGSSLKSSLKNRGKQSLKDIGKRILSGAGSGVRRKRKYKLKSLRKLKTKKIKARKKIAKSRKTRKTKRVSRNSKTSQKSRKKHIKRRLPTTIMKSADCSRSRKNKSCPKDIFSQ